MTWWQCPSSSMFRNSFSMMNTLVVLMSWRWFWKYGTRKRTESVFLINTGRKSSQWTDRLMKDLPNPERNQSWILLHPPDKIPCLNFHVSLENLKVFPSSILHASWWKSCQGQIWPGEALFTRMPSKGKMESMCLRKSFSCRVGMKR